MHRKEGKMANERKLCQRSAQSRLKQKQKKNFVRKNSARTTYSQARIHARPKTGRPPKQALVSTATDDEHNSDDIDARKPDAATRAVGVAVSAGGAANDVALLAARIQFASQARAALLGRRRRAAQAAERVALVEEEEGHGVGGDGGVLAVEDGDHVAEGLEGGGAAGDGGDVGVRHAGGEVVDVVAAAEEECRAGGEVDGEACEGAAVEPAEARVCRVLRRRAGEEALVAVDEEDADGGRGDAGADE